MVACCFIISLNHLKFVCCGVYGRSSLICASAARTAAYVPLNPPTSPFDPHSLSVRSYRVAVPPVKIVGSE